MILPSIREFRDELRARARIARRRETGMEGRAQVVTAGPWLLFTAMPLSDLALLYSGI